jgi:hypothetical protein
MRDHLTYERLGGTFDDAAGEAFDKVARLLGLGYPGGPAVQAAAETGDAMTFKFPRAWMEGSWDFSFSGLKTAVLRDVRAQQPDLEAGVETPRPGLPIADLAASFQASVVDVLVTKTLSAAETFEAKEVLVAGGVSANRALREAFRERSPLPVRVPPLALCTDNAAMIGAVGHWRYLSGQRTRSTWTSCPPGRLPADRIRRGVGGQRHQFHAGLMHAVKPSPAATAHSTAASSRTIARTMMHTVLEQHRAEGVLGPATMTRARAERRSRSASDRLTNAIPVITTTSAPGAPRRGAGMQITGAGAPPAR